MEITYYGDTAIRIKGKSGSIIIDPTPAQLKIEADLVAWTQQKEPSGLREGVIELHGPGEYEVKGIHVVGISESPVAEGMTPSGKTGYLATVDLINCLHLGTFMQSKLDDAQLEELEHVDVLLVPIGDGVGLSTSAAAKLAAHLEATIVIPIILASADAKAALQQAFLKDMGKEGIEGTKKLVMSKEKLPEEPQVVLLDVS